MVCVLALSAISTSTLAELDKAESVLQSETDAENEFQVYSYLTFLSYNIGSHLC